MLASNYFFQPQSLFPFWLLYCLMCLPLSYLIVLLAPYRMHRQSLYTYAFFYLLCISIVGFGVFFALILALVLLYQKPKKNKNPPWSIAEQPDYQRSPLFEPVSYGEGSGFKIVTSSKASKTLRQKLLVAANQFETRQINKINSLALSDDLDEVRLFAQSLMEKQERHLLNLIKLFIKKLLTTKDTVKAASYKKYIAQLMWEQVYKYLVVNETLPNTLKTIKMHAKEAFEILTKDVELPLLLAKVALQQSELEEAKQWLKQAVTNEAPDYKILSSLAEIEYIEKKYAAIKGTLAPCQARGIINLQPIISFWVTHD